MCGEAPEAVSTLGRGEAIDSYIAFFHVVERLKALISFPFMLSFQSAFARVVHGDVPDHG